MLAACTGHGLVDHLQCRPHVAVEERQRNEEVTRLKKTGLASIDVRNCQGKYWEGLDKRLGSDSLSE